MPPWTKHVRLREQIHARSLPDVDIKEQLEILCNCTELLANALFMYIYNDNDLVY